MTARQPEVPNLICVDIEETLSTRDDTLPERDALHTMNLDIELTPQPVYRGRPHSSVPKQLIPTEADFI
jgi:hypothetical protein